MDNLTRSLRIAFSVPDCSPVPDHDLVIFKKVGAGLEFRDLVPAGKRFQKKLLDWGDYEAFAVSRDENLRHVFSHPDTHLDQIHSYILRFTLLFEVSNPRRLAEKLDGDPLRRLQQETIELLGGAARHLDWHILVTESLELERTLLGKETTSEQGVVLTNLEKLRRVAKDLGISLGTISIQRSLPKRETDVPEKVRDLQDTAFIEAVKHELDEQRQRREGQLRGNEAVTQVTLEVLRDTSATADARRRIRDLSETGREALKLIGPQASVSNSTAGSRLLTVGAGNGVIGDLQAGVLQLILDLGRDSAAGLRLGSLLLHLVAELSMGKEAEEEVLKKYAGEIAGPLREVSRRLNEPQQIKLIDRLRDPLRLKEEISREEMR
jgi:hypothetical protein